MKLADLYIKLGLKKEGFDKGIDSAKKKTSAFGSAMKKIGGIIAGAFAVSVIKNFATQSLELYNIQAQAEKQLLVALKNRKGAQQDLIRQAQQLQGITLYGDEETIKAQALIAAFVKEKDQIKAIIPLVQDLAAAKNMQLSAAADLVSKTLGSSTNALSRYGIEVVGTVGSVERLESLMGGLSNAFGGQAVAAANAGTGSIIQLKNAIGDLKEEVGKLIATGDGFKKYISGSIKEVQDWASIIGDESKSGFKKWGLFLLGSKSKWREVAEEIRSTAIAQEQMMADAPFEFKIDGTDLDFELPEWGESQATYLESLQEVLKQTKIELKALMDTGGKWHGEDNAESFIKKVDELESKIEGLDDKIKGLTPLDRDTSSMPMMESIGLSGDEFEIDAPTNSLDAWSGYFKGLFDIIQQGKEDALQETADLRDSLNQSFEMMIEDSIGALASDFGEAMASGDWSGFGDGVLQVIGGFMQQLGALLIAYAVNMGLFAAAATNPLSWPIALAAGVAMVAAGAAISSFASGGLSGSGATSASGYSSSSSSASTALSGNVSFQLEGDKLIGAISNSRSKRRLTS